MTSSSRRLLRATLFLVFCLPSLLLLLTPPAEAKDILVFAAASLRNALDDAVAHYPPPAGGKITVSYAASSTLAKQVENGAPADIFISADLDWMDYLQKRNLIKTASRLNLLGNRLVLVAPKDSAIKVEITRGFPLAKLLGDGRLAMGDPSAVPAGKYGKAALEKLGVWSSVSAKVAPAEDVRAALLLVSRGEAPLGIVYASDAVSDPGVKQVAVFPADSHPPVIYPAALLASSSDPAAAAFLTFLESDAARPYFEKQGFSFRPE